MKRIHLGILFLIIMMVAGGSVASSGEITTGIEAFRSQHCWYDDTHVIILLRTQPPHGDTQTEGLFILDVMKPRELTRLDLAPLSLDVQRGIDGLTCQDQTIMFFRHWPTPQVPELYTMRLSSPPERLGQLRGYQGSLRGQYLLASNAKRINDGGPEQGTFLGHDDCDIRYVRPGFRVLCWDAYQFRQWWPLTNWVLAEYGRQESIKVRTEQGTKHIPNPTKPLLGKDGKPISYGLHLHDINGQIVATLSDDPRYRPSVVVPSITPDENYIYAPCSERTRRTDEYLGVCRYRLDGQQHGWEEVFRSDLVERIKSSITKIAVSNSGDVYFYAPASAPHGGIWRFDARLRTIDHVVADTATHSHSNPSVSPNGEWLLYVRSGKDGAKFILLQGGAR